MIELNNNNEMKINIVTYVLDDQPFVLKLIERAFQNANIVDYKLFDDVDKFIEALDDQVHLAVVDYILGSSDLTGIDVCKKILEVNPRCYIIIMSGQGDNDVIIEFMNSGAKKYVPKWKEDYMVQVADFVQQGVAAIKRDLEFYSLLLSKTQPKENGIA